MGAPARNFPLLRQDIAQLFWAVATLADSEVALELLPWLTICIMEVEPETGGTQKVLVEGSNPVHPVEDLQPWKVAYNHGCFYLPSNLPALGCSTHLAVSCIIARVSGVVP